MPVDPGHLAVCSECGEDREIVLPERLIRACVDHRLVLFVGAGASTESHNVMPNTFYDVVRSRLEIADTPAFPTLMDAFVHEFSRTDLVLEFFERLRYIDKFEDLRRRATKFHRAVAVNPFLREIITTNWDDYFEREAGAIPLVQGSDFDYWSVPGRKVLKIHGSTLNPGSMVATTSDYQRSLRALRRGALGTTASHWLATKSVAFIGYAMRDDDIREMITALRTDLGQAAQRVYFVHPNPSFEPPIPDATVFHTSAESFIRQLDDELVAREYLYPTTMYDRVADLKWRVSQAMARALAALPHDRYPLSIFNHAYQDGVMHACHRIESSRRYGDDRANGHLVHIYHSYDEAARHSLGNRDYWNQAYWEGYATGLFCSFASEVPVSRFPLYFCPGLGHETSLERLRRAVRGGPQTHQTAYRWAKRQTDQIQPGMVIEHTPFG